jgi:hypothetical protein
MQAFTNLLLSSALCLGINLHMNGQSIYQDVNSVLWAVSVLNDSTAAATEADSAAVLLLGILSQYDQPAAVGAAQTADFAFLRERYAGNEFLQEVTNLDYGHRTSLNDEELRAGVAAYQRQLTGSPRMAIAERLSATQSPAPSDYLSVAKTIKEYQTPSFPPIQAIKLSAAMSSQPAGSGSPLTQAAIIEGTARFILERAKDEIIVSFLDRMLTGEKDHYLDLFPTVVQEFGSSAVNFSGPFIARLREAFYEDLQMLSLRLPEILLENDKFAAVQADMTGYNLLALYSLVNLVQQGVAVEEALPLVNRYLYHNFLEKARQSNLQLAAKAAQDARYLQLIRLSESAYEQIYQIYLDLEDGEREIASALANTPGGDAAGQNPPDRNLYLGKPLYRIDSMLLSSSTNSYGLDLLPRLLEGSFDSATIMAYNTLSYYDLFFSREWMTDTLRATGLELVRKLCGNWHEEQSIADLFDSWQKDLAAFKGAADRWMMTRATPPERMDITQLVDNLREEINERKNYWKSLAKLNYQHQLAFASLENLLSETVFQGIEDELSINPDIEESNFDQVLADRMEYHLQAVALRLQTLDANLKARHPGLGFPSLEGEILVELFPYGDIAKKIGKLRDSMDNMKQLLVALDSAYGGNLSKARENARPFLQISSLASNLLYCLHTGDPQQSWLSMAQLDSLLDGGQKETVFLALVQQCLRNGSSEAPLSPTGLSDLARLTLRDLLLLSDTLQPDSLRATGNAAFFGKAFFAVYTLNRLLEIPLVLNEKGSGYAPLKDRLGKAAQIPDLSEELLRFLYFINIKAHGKAISSLIRTFSMLEALDPNADEATKTFLRYLQQYGYFIGGLVDATNKEEVKELLEEIADPPGSSRIKRKSPLSASINAYLGGNIGQERWQGNQQVEKSEFGNAAVTMPVGVALSCQVFRNSKRPQSFSAFVSLLDLAAAIPTVDPEQQGVEMDLTFKNVLKPGIQLHWNIQKSPFYLGIGYQHGPVFLEVDGRKDRVQANRFFLGAGVDVPILTLFRR